MPQISIPSTETKIFTRSSKGEMFGNLYATKNIDLISNRGKIRLAGRVYRLFDNDDDADMETPVKFIRSNADQTDKWWALCQANANSTSDGLLFKTTDTNPDGTWGQDAIASSPTDCVDDMEIFGQVTTDRLVVARDTDLAMLENGAWTASWWDTTLAQAALTDTNPHPLHQFLNLLLVADGNVVHTIDDSLVVVASRITLPKEYQIIWIEDDGIRTYFGTRHIRNGEALVFPWDGTSQTYDTPLGVGDMISLAGIADKNGVMHTINGKGQLLGYNGQAFGEVDHFPCYGKELRWGLTSVARGQVVHPNGVALIDGKINIMLRAQVGSGYLYENFSSGIWELDEEAGLYHKYQFGRYDNSANDEWGTIWNYTTGALRQTLEEDGRFLVGAEYQIDSSTSTRKRGIYILKTATDLDQRGYFITSEIQSAEISNFWKRLKLVFTKIKNSGDAIVVKYRTEKNRNFIDFQELMNSIALTWTSTTVFTSTNADLANAAVGDEIEITQGKGAGATAHISAISEAGGTYTVTLDEAIPNAASTGNARINNWKKLGSITSTTIQKKIFKIAKRTGRIQFKIEIRGSVYSPELEQIIIEYNPSKR